MLGYHNKTQINKINNNQTIRNINVTDTQHIQLRLILIINKDKNTGHKTLDSEAWGQQVNTAVVG